MRNQDQTQIGSQPNWRATQIGWLPIWPRMARPRVSGRQAASQSSYAITWNGRYPDRAVELIFGLSKDGKKTGGRLILSCPEFPNDPRLFWRADCQMTN